MWGQILLWIFVPMAGLFVVPHGVRSLRTQGSQSWVVKVAKWNWRGPMLLTVGLGAFGFFTYRTVSAAVEISAN